MKKYLALGLLMCFLGYFQAKAMGPIPMLNPGQTYQTNPAYKMTAQQRYAVSQAFAWAQNAFQRNHSVCRNRGECLNLDLRSLTGYINTYPQQLATRFFQNIFNIIRNDSVHQRFVSEWVVFQNLSPERQAEYRNGVRMTPIQPQNVITASGTSTPAFFNQDDVFTDVLQSIDHHHKNCDQFVTCLRGDLQIINNFYERLSYADPVRAALQRLSRIISTLATQKMFNTSLYLDLYNPLSPNWSDVARKQKAKKLGSYGYSEWKKVERSSRPSSWRTPRITNGTPQNRNFRTRVEDLRSNVQTQRQGVKDMWNNNRDLLKGWW